MRDPKVCLKKKLWKSGTLLEHLPKMYYFRTIINQKKNNKWDTFGCDTLGSWTVNPIIVFFSNHQGLDPKCSGPGK